MGRELIVGRKLAGGGSEGMCGDAGADGDEEQGQERPGLEPLVRGGQEGRGSACRRGEIR